MRAHRSLFLASLIGTVTAFTFFAQNVRLESTRGADLPSSLSDKEFWALSESMSEPNGSFQSDNLLSNELAFGRILPELVARTKPGGVYLGVGPEQNFTYIAAMRPRMAIITDIRRGNLHMHLMYKALFEMSADRAEFVSRLFTKPRPEGLTVSSSVAEIMDAFWEVRTSDETAYNSNLAAIHAHLTKTRRLPLIQEDLDGIARVYRTFYWYGPAMNYSASTQLSVVGTGRSMGATYRDLMTQGSVAGQGLSYLGSEMKFLFLKDLQRKNLIVPVVGNFAGPKALRAVGAYLKTREATVSAFYLSNVEQYLRRDALWQTFCENVATMPLDETSVFIRPSGMGSMRFVTNPSPTGSATVQILTIRPPGGPGLTTAPVSGLFPIAVETRNCGGAPSVSAIR